MKRIGLVGLALLVTAVPVAAMAEVPRSTFVLEGQGRALELGLGDQGLTAGFAFARADSTPHAMGVGAGQCALLGDDPEPDDLPCNESTMAASSAPGEGSPDPSCAGPALPAPLNTVVTLDLACGSSRSAIAAGAPSTSN